MKELMTRREDNDASCFLGRNNGHQRGRFYSFNSLRALFNQRGLFESEVHIHKGTLKSSKV